MSGLALRTHLELQDHPSEHSFGCESCVLTFARYSLSSRYLRLRCRY